MENNEKRDRLIEDLHDRLQGEEMPTALNAVMVLYVAYVAKFGEEAREGAERLMEKVNNTIKEEWQ